SPPALWDRAMPVKWGCAKVWLCSRAWLAPTRGGEVRLLCGNGPCPCKGLHCGVALFAGVARSYRWVPRSLLQPWVDVAFYIHRGSAWWMAIRWLDEA